MSEFDFIKAFAGIDILAVEAVGEVIGRVEASVYKGMVSAGLDSEVARAIIRDAHAEFVRAVLS